jgi:hypothetical protein
MTSNAFASHAIHNAACEQAAQANCHCRCHGAGHQFDLIVRAAKCDTQTDEDALRMDLEKIFGGFHTKIRDVATPTRSSRNHLTPIEAATLKLDTGKGATWAETLWVDEAVHAAFIEVAGKSRKAGTPDRLARADFITRITRNSISVVGSPVTANNIANSHVWCSIVAEFVDSLSQVTRNPGKPLKYDQICYPRVTRAETPPSLPAVRANGLQHLATEYNAASALSVADRFDLLRLVGMATCADPWHHPAIVRHCINPFVISPIWPPAGTTTIANAANFRSLSSRWTRKRHW